MYLSPMYLHLRPRIFPCIRALWSNRQIRFFARVAGCCRLDSRSKSAPQPRSPGEADATVATDGATHTYNRILQWGLNSRKVFEHITTLRGRFCNISRFLFIFPYLSHFLVNISLADYCWDFKLRTRHSIGGGDETGVRPRPPPLPPAPSLIALSPLLLYAHVVRPSARPPDRPPHRAGPAARGRGMYYWPLPPSHTKSHSLAN